MVRVSYLNLHTLIPQRDVRKLIYAKLTRHEFFTVCVAHGRSSSFPVEFADHCAENGYLELLQWAIEKKCVHNSRIYYYAARNGHLKLLQWFWEESSNIKRRDRNACTGAAQGGHLEILQWVKSLSSHEQIGWVSVVCLIAAEKGYLNILKWVEGQDYRIGPSVCFQAAKNGHLNILQWVDLFTEGTWDWNDCYNAAAENGHLEVVQWLRKNESS